MFYKLQKVISGGQVGADQAGLKSAYDNNIATGGWAPKGYLTFTGNNPKLLKEKYGLSESKSNYKGRTYLNVKYSDGTLRFACNFNSPGERCTLGAINKYNKPYLDIILAHNDLKMIRDMISNDIYDWLHENNISVLNVAGNLDRKSYPVSIFEETYKILYKVFKKIKED